MKIPGRGNERAEGKERRILPKRAAGTDRKIPQKGAAGKDRQDAPGRTDYRVWHFTPKERAKETAVYAGFAVMIVWLFYRRMPLILLAVPFYPFYMKKAGEKRAAARRKQLSYDFRLALDSLTVSLRAGRSVENAFPDAARDLRNTIGEEMDVTKEFVWISRQIRLSVPMEDVLLDFAGRSGVEDIENFAAVFTTAKRMGGNMASILKNAAASIGGKIDVEREIETTLAAKKMEQKIMNSMPCVIILYMTLASPGFLDLMYTTAFGALIMTVCLMLYAAAVLWAGKIVDIEV